MSHRTRKVDAANPTRPSHEIVIEDVGTWQDAESHLFHERKGFAEKIYAAADRYGLAPRQVCKEYHLIRALHELGKMLGPDLKVPRPYVDTYSTVGHLFFGGGTALTAAWQISERYSEDIDLVLVPADGVNGKQVKQSLRDLGITWGRNVGGKYVPEEGATTHHFFVINIEDPALGLIKLDVDIVVKESPETLRYVQQRKPVSLLGNSANEDEAEMCPELGLSSRSSWIPTIMPEVTAMEKLLAQTGLSQENNLPYISGRARDIYDLARIAEKRGHEGHSIKDVSVLLALAEKHSEDADEAKRPVHGFASLASFRPGTSQYEALAIGYEEVLKEMVWGERIPLDRAIELTVSLDPGPPVSAAG